MKKGYRLHIEADESEPLAFADMAELRAHQKDLAKEYGRTFAQIERMSYIVTEDEYQKEIAMQADQ